MVIMVIESHGVYPPTNDDVDDVDDDNDDMAE